MKLKSAIIPAFCLLYIIWIAIFSFIPQSYLFPKTKLAEYFGKKITLIGQIIEEPEYLGTKNRYQIENIFIKVKEFIHLEGKIQVTGRRQPEYKFGQWIALQGKLKEPPTFDDFSYKDYLLGKGILAIMDYPDIQVIKEPPIKNDFLKNFWLSLRISVVQVKEKFTRALERCLPEPYASFILGILIGGRKGLSRNIQDAFSATGIAHVVAVSGYNISIITSFLGRFLKKNLPNWLSLGILFSFVFLFMAAAGFSASVVRAGIMGLVLLWTTMFGRGAQGLQLLVYAVTFMLAINPLLLRFDIGFQLSVLATAGLIILAPKIEPGLRKLRLPRFWHEALLATISAMIMTLPILILNFKQISLVSPLVNLIVLPFIPWTMLAGFVTGIAALIFLPLGILFGYISYILCYVIIYVVQAFASLPFSHTEITLSWEWSILYYFLIILLVYGKHLREKLKVKNAKAECKIQTKEQTILTYENT